MRHFGRNRLAVGVLMAIVAFSLHAEPLRYEVKIDLGVGIYAIKLNNFDQVLGKQQGVDGIWSPGAGFAALPAPIGVTSGFTAVDLNDKAEVIGTTTDKRGGTQGLFWTSLKTAPVAISQGQPVAINAKSHVALWGFDPLNQPLIWSNGKTTPLANYKNGTLLPIDINDHDEVAAIAVFGPAVLLTQSTAHEIALVPPAVVFSPNPGLYVNNAGNVAGNSQHFFNERQVSRAFLWSSQSGAIDLGTPGTQSSFVMGLDDRNRVLGYLDRDGGTPFVWQAGIGITELTSLIDLGDEYARMQSVVDMNSRGEILGSLLDKEGRPHIVVLMPVPEPAVWLIGAVGMLAVLYRRRRARTCELIAQRRGSRRSRLWLSIECHPMMSSGSIAIVAGFILGTGVTVVQATVVEWQLQDVTFDDGGTATGFISIDVDLDGLGPTPGSNPQLVDWDIKVQGGNMVHFPPFEYTPASTFGAYLTLSITQGGGPKWDTMIFDTGQILPGGDPFQHRGLYLVTRPQMTDAGGRVILTADNIPSRESWNPAPGRMASGALTAVPEPSSVMFVALGFAALLGAWARRKL